MSGSFKNPTKIDTKMTSNDYINSKKNKQLFCPNAQPEQDSKAFCPSNSLY